MIENPFARALCREKSSLPAPPPDPFDVRLSRLTVGYQTAIHRAIERRELDACLWNGEWWANYEQLADLTGPGNDVMDVAGGCYIPTNAMHLA